MPDSNADPAQREILRQIRDLSERVERQGKEQTDRYDRLDRAINSTETPIGVRLDVRDIKRTLDGQGREKGLIERIDNLEAAVDSTERKVDGVRDALEELASTGKIENAHKKGILQGRAGLIAAFVTFLTIVSIIAGLFGNMIGSNP